jgi:hypothetical protein
VRSIAKAMADAQRLEITEMAVAQTRTGLDPQPPGFDADHPVERAAVDGGHEGHG